MAPRSRRDGSTRTSSNEDFRSLLNFQMGESRMEARPSRNRTRKTNGSMGSKVSIQRGRELYRLAQCHFLVADTSDLEGVTEDVDRMPPWEDVLRVELHSEKEWACPICLEDHMVCPHMTPCGHVYCLPCIVQDIVMSKEMQKGHGCPQCYAKFIEKELRPAKIVKVDRLVVGEHVRMELMYRRKGETVAIRKGEMESESARGGSFPWTSTGTCDRFSKYTLTSSADAVLEECLSSMTASTALLQEQVLIYPEAATQLSYTAISGDMLKERVADWKSRREEKLLDKSACSSPAASSSEGGYWFYQLSDGRPVFLHSLNFRIMMHQYGSPSRCPALVEGKVLEIDSITQTEELRKRMRYFSHVTLSTNILLCEMDLSAIYTKESLDLFKEELQQRHRRRKRRAKKEAKEADKESKKSVGELMLELNNMPRLSSSGACEEEDILEETEAEAAPIYEAGMYSGSPSWSNVTKLGFASGWAALPVGDSPPLCGPSTWPREGQTSTERTSSWAEGLRSGFGQGTGDGIHADTGSSARKKGGKHMVILSTGQRRKY